MTDRLDDAALDLALGAERVDHPTDVVHGIDPLDHDLAGLDVHRDLCDLDSVGHDSHSGRVRSTGALPEDLTVLEQAGDLVERPRAAIGADDLAVGE